MKTGQFGTLQSLAAEIDRRNSTQKDFITGTQNMTVRVEPTPQNQPEFTLQTFTNGSGHEAYRLNDLALEQMGTKAEIPASYQRKLIDKDPELLAYNINALNHKFPVNRMVRTLDGKARAFLSDKYKRIDNFPVLETILPAILEKGPDLEVMSCDVTDTRMYLKVVSPRLQGEIKVGDILQAGIIISNSEVGLGSWKMQMLLYTLACMNGMITGKDVTPGIEKRHLGSKQTEGILYREDTVFANSKAFALQVRDTFDSLLDEGNFQKTLERLRATTENRIAPKADPSKVIIELGREVGFTQNEGSTIMQHLIRGGDLSQYGLANAVTRYAQDDEVSYDRSTELEAIGGKIVDLNGRKLERILEAA